MRSTSADLTRFLEDLATKARPNEQLPTIRELMRQFGVSQVTVQKAFTRLKAAGLVVSEVGRGTYFRGGGASAGVGAHAGSAPSSAVGIRSLLLLRRSISIARGRVLVEMLNRSFSASGHRVLEVSYTDPDHARAVLQGLPRFDACVVQSTYKPIPVELLSALRERTAVLAVDGLALVGTDAEAVGTEWGEPLAQALAHLVDQGHRRILFATTSHPLLATQLGMRRLDYLKASRSDLHIDQLTVPQLPDDHYEEALAARLAALKGAGGRLPFTALAVWGVESGETFRALLSAADIDVPSDLSIVLLGRTDLANEHASFFTTFGCSVGDQAAALQQAILARWADPAAAYGVRLIPVTHRLGTSVASLAQSGT